VRTPNRRQFLQGSLALAGLVVLSGCGALRPEIVPAARVHRIGFLSLNSADAGTEAFRQGMRELGYVEGQTVAIELRFADGYYDRLPGLAAELVGLNLDVIVAGSSQAAQPVSQLTGTIPIVVASGDPVGTGLIANQARPEGNITGLTTASTEFAAKWLELLHEAVPTIARVAVVYDPGSVLTDPHLREIERAARQHGVQLQSMSARDGGELEPAFAAMRAASLDGLVVVPGGTPTRERSRIARLTVTNRLPAVGVWPDFAADGGLIAYGADFLDLQRRAATYVDKILKGARPTDLPVERPTTFEFVINLKTAQALGLTIPPSVLAQATEVIQ